MQPSRLLTARFSRRNPSPITSADRLPAFLYAISASCRRRTSTDDGSLPLSSSPSAITDLLSSFSRAGFPFEARHLLLSLKSPTVFHYNTVIHSLAVSNHASDALRLFDDMLARGVSPNAASFTILVKIQSFYLNDVDSANEVFESMSRYKVAPDPVAYSTLIAGFCRFGRIQEACKVLDEMIQRKCTPNINAFTLILRAYCMKGMVGEAKRLIFLMEKNGFVPDTIIYSVLIEGLCRIGEFDEVERVLGECDLKGWKPNEVTYNSYMNGLCKWGRVDEAFRQLEAMQSRGLYPDNVTLGILFDCLCRDDSMLCTAKCLLERNFELGWYVDVYVYNSLMNKLCETGNWSSVLKLLTDMVKKGIDPDACTFTIVIRSLCLAGKCKKAVCVICSQGFDADIVAFNTLIHWLSMAGMVAEARHMFDMMNGQSIVPNEFTYCMMIDCLCKSGYFCEAIKCVLPALNCGFLPDLVARLNYWLIKEGKFEEMLSLFDEILTRGVAINGVVVSSTIKAFCRKGFCLRKELNKVCLILDKMLGIR